MASTTVITPNTMLPPPISLITLPSEILHSIISYIDQREIRRIIRVCKLLYAVGFSHFLEDVAFGDPAGGWQRSCIRPSQWRMLIDKDNGLSGGEYHGGVPRLPWNWNKRIAILGTAPLKNLELLKMLGVKLKEGEVRPEHVEINVSDTLKQITTLENAIPSGFFQNLKSYAHQKHIKEFSYSLEGGNLLFMVQGLNLLQCENVTSIVYNNDRNYGAIPRSETSAFQGLSKLFAATVNLQRLSIQLVKLRSLGNADLQASIQAAFDGLHNLKELKITGELFSCATFITPPPNIITLEYQCEASPMWWLGFSKCKLPKVENLTLKCCYSDYKYYRGSRAEAYRARYEPHGVVFNDNGKFIIEDVAVTTLKKFNGDANPSAPADLVEAILNRNPGLSKKSTERMFHQMIRPRLLSCISRMENRMVEYADSVTEEFGEMWKLGTRGEELEEEFFKESLEMLMKEFLEGKAKEWVSLPSKYALKNK
ncbi:hypothetical protein TWF718_008764 [Orbilia javanica]|uniref:F-box domain-containing protein n=1 Tax=Orbilia javanica TaxID=47235 RepID=A0AAN8MLA8_9PEZI